MDVVDGILEGTAFTPEERENLARQRRLAKAYRERGREALKREMQAIERERNPESAEAALSETR